MKITTVILQGVPPLGFIFLINLVGVVSFTLTEGNNMYFVRGTPVEIFYFYFYPLFASLGNPTKANQLNTTTGIFQGVPPLSSFLYLTVLVSVIAVPLTEANNQNFARDSSM